MDMEPEIVGVRLVKPLGGTPYVGLTDGAPGSYGMVFPDLPGCSAMGETSDDVVRAASEAVADWIDTVVAVGGEVPVARFEHQLSAARMIMKRDNELLRWLAHR